VWGGTYATHEAVWGGTYTDGAVSVVPIPARIGMGAVPIPAILDTGYEGCTSISEVIYGVVPIPVKLYQNSESHRKLSSQEKPDLRPRYHSAG